MENNSKEKKEQKVSWNLSESLIQEIGDLLKEASRTYIQNHFDKTFSILKAVRMRIIDRLKDDELKIFVDMENKMYLLSKLKNNREDFGAQSLENLKYSYEFWKLLDDYNNMLLKTMRKYGYLIQAKEDKTRLQI